MSLGNLLNNLRRVVTITEPAVRQAITYGNNKATGGHDHRTNKGDDRTPAQKAGDENRRGPRGLSY